jgi:hypothetical protein
MAKIVFVGAGEDGDDGCEHAFVDAAPLRALLGWDGRP